MDHLPRIVDHLDDFLRIGEFPDASQNGLQVSGRDAVRRIATMVDASRAGIEAAIEAKADMIVVHHGLLWSKPVTLTGIFYERVRLLVENKVSLYAAHLPLDAHPETGNNIQLLQLVGAQLTGWYAEWGGKPIGCLGKFDRPRPLAHIIEVLDEGLGTQTKVLDYGPDEITTVGIVSGAASEALFETKRRGADLFITGEPRLNAVHEARELEINVAFSGHYATESTGVKALSKRLPSWFDVEALYIDVPCDV
ncbi:Nif3-like dinuclear metal center hexameric protein [bacterium]|nr:Nif3-like dinuclear metal center hexameric protein [bacterium]